MNPKRILIPVDPDQAAFDGMEFVAGLAGEMHISATLLHVVKLNISSIERRVYTELCVEKERRLRVLAKHFFAGKLPLIQIRLGRPHEQILMEAKEGQAELIVIASSKISRSHWRFLPTTIERIVRDAPCLTLVLPRTWKINAAQYRQAMHDRTRQEHGPGFSQATLSDFARQWQ